MSDVILVKKDDLLRLTRYSCQEHLVVGKTCLDFPEKNYCCESCWVRRWAEEQLKAKNPNTDNLQGMRCPVCGSYEPFDIWAQSSFTVYDEGTDTFKDVEWDNDSGCSCPCGFTGVLKDFKEGEKDAEL